MNDIEALAGIAAPRTANFVERQIRAGLLTRLQSIGTGRIHWIDPDLDQRTDLGSSSLSGLSATVRVHHPRFYRRLAFGGSIGAGESFMDGDWSTDDLTSLIRILAQQNRGAAVDRGWSRLVTILDRWRHRLRRNSRSGSRKNIAEHYDLSNEFFACFLDPSWMYSCALFENDGESLEVASRRKLDVICRKLALRSADRVVEIGSGWGGFALHAAKYYGCHVTTTTLSQEQHDFANQVIHREGLSDRVTVLLQDYRDLLEGREERFDALVSIEMVEAVGHRFLPRYLETCSRLLKRDGLGLIQAILIPDQVYESYRRNVDFIQRHIFPGGCLPSLARIQQCIRTRTDLRLIDLQDLTPHYATTLRRWRNSFRAQSGRIRDLGFDDRFQRAWEFYFGYCEGGFLERTVGTSQLLFAKPGNRRPLPVPQS